MQEGTQFLAQVLDVLQAHYRRLKQAVAAAEQSHAHYLDALQADYRARVQAIATDFWAQAGGDAAQPTELPTSVRWAALPWDAYAPAADAPLPTAVRVGRLAEVGLATLPALVPLIGRGHIFLAGDDPEAARQLLQTLLLRLIVVSPPGSVGSVSLSVEIRRLASW